MSLSAVAQLTKRCSLAELDSELFFNASFRWGVLPLSGAEQRPPDEPGAASAALRRAGGRAHAPRSSNPSSQPEAGGAPGLTNHSAQTARRGYKRLRCGVGWEGVAGGAGAAQDGGGGQQQRLPAGEGGRAAARACWGRRQSQARSALLCPARSGGWRGPLGPALCDAVRRWGVRCGVGSGPRVGRVLQLRARGAGAAAALLLASRSPQQRLALRDLRRLQPMSVCQSVSVCACLCACSLPLRDRAPRRSRRAAGVG